MQGESSIICSHGGYLEESHEFYSCVEVNPSKERDEHEITIIKPHETTPPAPMPNSIRYSSAKIYGGPVYGSRQRQ